jgi:hypothetical protein
MSDHVRKRDFVIVGAAKCGAASLHDYPRGHPQVFMPNFKSLLFGRECVLALLSDDFLSDVGPAADQAEQGFHGWHD